MPEVHSGWWITIGGVEVTDSVGRNSLAITNVLRRQMDTCEFRLLNTAVTEWSEVVVYGEDAATKEFGGYLVEIEEEQPHEVKTVMCRCQDYSVLLATKLVTQDYESKTDKYIIQNLVNTYLPGEGINVTTYVAQSRTITRIVFERMSVLACIQEICKLTDYDFYIDPDKNLHYFNKETNLAPFTLSTQPDWSASVPYRLETHHTDGSEIVNRVTVEGGTYLSNDEYFYLAGNGEQTEFNLTRGLHAPMSETGVQIWRNDGSDAVPVWTPLVVGVLYVHQFADGYDVLYGWSEKVLVFEVAPSLLKYAARIYGRYDVPVLVRRRSQQSYDQYGRWFDGVVKDESLSSQEAAQLKAWAVLWEKAFAVTRGRLATYYQGLRSGQAVRIIHDKLGIDDYWLIRQVTARPISPQHWQYTVEYGEYNPSVVDLLISIKKMADRHLIRDDEEMNDVLDEEEDVTLIETTELVPANEYHWADYTPSGLSIELRWSYGAWG